MGQVLVRNLFMPLDPVMCMALMGESGLPMPRYEIGEVLYGDAIGEVKAWRWRASARRLLRTRRAWTVRLLPEVRVTGLVPA
ncbi:hypothetical protein [Streptomyces sp. NPDC093094]|uniref:hypothetical protein n=1 Tax=Streptomyces sp. NPDC093094 TaxID=3366026 RepID=UPI0037F86740